MSETIRFKSEQDNYRKEYIGLKNNTLRTFDKEGDLREQILNKYLMGLINNLFIEIEHFPNGEYFRRKVTDVTKYKEWYIITFDTRGFLK